jgi:ketosteroid isomerase-like protein
MDAHPATVGSDADARAVMAIFDAFNRRSLPEMLSLADPEIELRPLRMSGPEVWRGHDGIRRLYERFDERRLDHRIEIDRTRRLPDGRIVALGRVVMGDVQHDFVGIHVVRGGRVASAHHMFSYDGILRRLGLLD